MCGGRPWHSWSRWKVYVWQGRVAPRIALFKLEADQALWPDVTEDRQRRECMRCGLTQDERL